MPFGGCRGASGECRRGGASQTASARRGAGGGAWAQARPPRPGRSARAIRHVDAARPQPEQGDRARLLHRRCIRADAETVRGGGGLRDGGGARVGVAGGRRRGRAQRALPAHRWPLPPSAALSAERPATQCQHPVHRAYASRRLVCTYTSPFLLFRLVHIILTFINK